jgi:hypothetical protein
VQQRGLSPARRVGDGALLQDAVFDQPFHQLRDHPPPHVHPPGEVRPGERLVLADQV